MSSKPKKLSVFAGFCLKTVVDLKPVFLRFERSSYPGICQNLGFWFAVFCKIFQDYHRFFHVF
jgi:hypothetical protein